jgi:hypothetical protein
MNNIEKKLDALIGALGFDVEEAHIPADDMDASEWNKMFTSRYCSAIPTRPVATINYKLIKRKDPLDIFYDGVTLRVLTNNVIDIMTNPFPYKWIAYKKEAYDAVLGWFGDKFVILSDNKSFKVFGVRVILDE